MRSVAEPGVEAAHLFIADPANRREVETALRIRAVETSLYDLFGKGKLHGTIHTCLGQEFSGAILGKYIRQSDFVTSNHRCHGHFIGATQNWRGLIDEIVGNADGVCAGIGSSQHLWARNFMSNGQQGGMLPVAAGIALDRQLAAKGDVVVSFIGEGTLGEGIAYETLNLDALWGLPHVVVCENNGYSQSTPQSVSVAGCIADRAAAFSISTVDVDTWDLSSFATAFGQAIERARSRSLPSFIVLKTYRLNPHSKGDDQRDRSEIEWFRMRDPASLAAQDYDHFKASYGDFLAEAADYIDLALAKPARDAVSYFTDQTPRATPSQSTSWIRQEPPLDGQGRLAQQLGQFYHDWLSRDDTAMFIGEDIADPYGGAFKISKGFTTDFPVRARATPISEAAITGIGIGLASCGRRSIVEIMFGDFITYAFDQIVNNASKIFHITNKNADCPVVIRTPMGGRRGYGPTHSQSLERFLIGIDNCCTVALTSLIAIDRQLDALATLRCPVILLENKIDYTLRIFAAPDGMVVEANGADVPTIRIRPAHAVPGVTVLAYGGMARFVANALVDIFERTDVVPEMIVPVSICPLDLDPIARSVERTGALVIVEEGAGFGSVGGEILAQLSERAGAAFRSIRVSGKPVPVPSAPILEAAALPGIDDICGAIEALAGRRA